MKTFVFAVILHTALTCLRLEAQLPSMRELFNLTNETSTPRTSSPRPEKVLYVLSLLPYPDPEGREAFQPSWDEGPTLFLAEQLAVELINNRSNILDGYTIELVQGDSGCNLRSKANQALFEKLLFNDNKPPVGIVGPGCSNSALTVSSLIRREELSMLTIHVAGSLLLANRSLYEYSFGTLDSTTVFVQASLALMERNDWKHVGILYDESRIYYSSTASEFERDLRKRNDVLYFASAIYDTFVPLDVIVNDRIRVIFLLVGPDYLSRILCLACHNNVTYPIYQFIIVSRVIEEIEPVTFMYMGDPISCTRDEMIMATNGSLIIHYQLKSFQNVTDVGLSYNQFFDMYQQRVTDYNRQATSLSNVGNDTPPITPSFWAGSFFDAVWSMALAMNASIDRISELRSRDNNTYSFYGSGLANVLRENLLERNFSGLSGDIAYNRSSGYVIRNVNVYQIKNGKQMDLIAYYDKLNDTIVLSSDDGDFINGTFRTERTIYAVSLIVGGISLSTTVLSFILTVVLHILTIVYRQQKSVKASSTKLSHIAFIGCYLLALCGLVNFMVECLSGKISPTFQCNLFPILNASATLGGTLLFGPICARTWRLYRIYVHFTKPGRTISDGFLLMVILVLFTLNLFIAIVPSAVHPFLPHPTNVSHLLEVKDSQGDTTEFVIMETVTIVCFQNYYFIWFGCSIMFTVLLMFGSFWLAFSTRHIPHKNFQTHSIILLVYLLSGFITLGLLLYFLFTSNLLEYISLSVVLNASILFSCFLLFMPPLYPSLKHKWPFLCLLQCKTRYVIKQ